MPHQPRRLAPSARPPELAIPQSVRPRQPQGFRLPRISLYTADVDPDRIAAIFEDRQEAYDDTRGLVSERK